MCLPLVTPKGRVFYGTAYINFELDLRGCRMLNTMVLNCLGRYDLNCIDDVNDNVAGSHYRC